MRRNAGGTMRLGAWPCKIERGSTAFRAYGTTDISERHRHRYEFNCEYEKTLTDAGFRITGRSPDGKYVEIIVKAPGPSSWFPGAASFIRNLNRNLWPRTRFSP